MNLEVSMMITKDSSISFRVENLIDGVVLIAQEIQYSNDHESESDIQTLKRQLDLLKQIIISRLEW